MSESRLVNNERVLNLGFRHVSQKKKVRHTLIHCSATSFDVLELTSATTNRLQIALMAPSTDTIL